MSATVVVSQSTVYSSLPLAVRSVPICVQAAVPSGAYSNFTELTSVGSSAVAVSATRPRRNVDGSVTVPLGPVVSISTSVLLTLSTLPAASVEKYSIV